MPFVRSRCWWSFTFVEIFMQNPNQSITMKEEQIVMICYLSKLYGPLRFHQPSRDSICNSKLINKFVSKHEIFSFSFEFSWTNVESKFVVLIGDLFTFDLSNNWRIMNNFDFIECSVNTTEIKFAFILFFTKPLVVTISVFKMFQDRNLLKDYSLDWVNILLLSTSLRRLIMRALLILLVFVIKIIKEIC